MTHLHLRLAGWILTLYADGQVVTTCDDLDWPDWFPVAEREAIVRAMAIESNPKIDEDGINDELDLCGGAQCPPARDLARHFARAMGYRE